jgi:hypothetical protein
LPQGGVYDSFVKPGFRVRAGDGTLRCNIRIHSALPEVGYIQDKTYIGDVLVSLLMFSFILWSKGLGKKQGHALHVRLKVRRNACLREGLRTVSVEPLGLGRKQVMALVFQHKVESNLPV